MIPFQLNPQSGVPVHEQVAFAAKKAIISGQLTAEGLLDVRPGIGTVVLAPPPATGAERARLLGHEVEQLTVEARKLGLTVADLHAAIDEQWRLLQAHEEELQ